MTNIEKDIRKNFKGDAHLEGLVKFYFEQLGGEGGCEDCGDTLCYECLQILRRTQAKLNKQAFGGKPCFHCGSVDVELFECQDSHERCEKCIQKLYGRGGE